MKKRFLSLLMVLCLAATMVPGAFAADAKDEVGIPSGKVEDISVWDGVSREQMVNNTIANAAQYAWFVDSVNGGETYRGQTITLAVTVDLGGHAIKPIGGSSYKVGTKKVFNTAFAGTFDGGNKAIRNGSIESGSSIYNVGVFGFVNGGTIRNLNVESITAKNTQTNNEAATAAAVAAIYKGVVENVTVDEHCVVVGMDRTGGVVGSVRDKCVITGCVNKATITGSGMYTGGVIGASHDIDYSFILTGKPATITSCYSYGVVNGRSEVGGIVGYSDQATITDCHNLGSVSATGNYGTGGIVGFDAYNPRGLYKPSKGSSISNCSNSGAITGGRAAGIVGTLGVTPGQSQPSSNKTLTVISNCSNTGTITGLAGKCGSIFGYQITYAKGDASEHINHLFVKISGCTCGGSVNGAPVDVPTLSPYYTV